MLNRRTLYCPVCRTAFEIRRRIVTRVYRQAGLREGKQRYLWCSKCEAGYRIQRVWLVAGEWSKERLLETQDSMVESAKNMLDRAKKGDPPPVTPRPLMTRPHASSRARSKFEELKDKYHPVHGGST